MLKKRIKDNQKRLKKLIKYGDMIGFVLQNQKYSKQEKRAKKKKANQINLLFKDRSFLELPLRKRREWYRKEKNKIKNFNDSSIFSTDHDLSDWVNTLTNEVQHYFPTTYFDCHFLSKKSNHVYYNSYIVARPTVEYDEKHDSYLERLKIFKKNRKRIRAMWRDEDLFSDINFSTKEDEKKVEEDFREPINFMVENTTFKTNYSYQYGVGLEIVINNETGGLTKEEIEDAINIFLENGEKDLVIENKFNHKDKIIRLFFDEIASSCSIYYSVLLENKLEKELIQNNELTESEANLYFKKRFFGSADFENGTHQKHSKIRDKVEKTKIYERNNEEKNKFRELIYQKNLFDLVFNNDDKIESLSLAPSIDELQDVLFYMEDKLINFIQENGFTHFKV